MGLLILDARKSSRRSIEECADAIGVSAEQFEQYEQGAAAPSLPKLELFALFLKLPIEHFWGKQILPVSAVAQPVQEKDRLISLRNRVIGANLRMARNASGHSLSKLAEKTGITEQQIKQYELGMAAISVTELEFLSSVLEIPVERFYDEHGPIGRWRIQQGTLSAFQDLPPETQQFIAKPVNRPYLELAIRLSELSAEKLRAVAEVLLEITY